MWHHIRKLKILFLQIIHYANILNNNFQSKDNFFEMLYIKCQMSFIFSVIRLLHFIHKVHRGLWMFPRIWFLNFFFFVFCLFRAVPMAYGGSQVRDLIRAVATSLRQSHSNTGSQPCMQPTPQLTATPADPLAFKTKPNCTFFMIGGDSSAVFLT